MADEPSVAPPQSGSSPSPSASPLGNSVIPIVNKLQDILAPVVSDRPQISLPQMAVVGSQNSGKSSVFEALVGRDFLPRGHDVIAQAQSGTGKTSMIAVAVCQLVDTASREVQALILSPTRELAAQTEKVVLAVGGFVNVQAHACVGGKSAGEDIRKLEHGVHVVPAMDAVVKVFCTHTEPNFSLPWQRKRQYSSSSSGFVIGERRVLTNAHSVEHYTQVKLKKRGSDTKYLATVLAIGTECDIAMLTVDDNEFWEGVSPVEFGDLPALQDAITVVGYPIGGDTISATSGVVSRIEILSYVHGSTELLGLQIDATINSGKSGGPAFNEKGNCVGIAFQSLKHEDADRKKIPTNF